MNSTCGNNKKIHVGEADMVSLAFGMIAFWIKQHKKCTRRRMHSRPLLVVYCGRIYNCSILDVSPFILIYMTVRTLVESTWNRCFSKRNKMIRILRSILEFMSILTFTICIWYVWIREPIEMVFAELPNMPSQIHTHTHTYEVQMGCAVLFFMHMTAAAVSATGTIYIHTYITCASTLGESWHPAQLSSDSCRTWSSSPSVPVRWHLCDAVDVPVAVYPLKISGPRYAYWPWLPHLTRCWSSSGVGKIYVDAQIRDWLYDFGVFARVRSGPSDQIRSTSSA